MQRPRKIGIFAKITQFKHFTCRIHQKLRTFNVIFLKNWEIHELSVQLTSNLTILVENSKKSEFSAKRQTNFQKINICKFICGSVRVQK